jgi:hypothetical protein
VKSLEERIDSEVDDDEIDDEVFEELPATESIVQDIEDFLRKSSKDDE